MAKWIILVDSDTSSLKTAGQILSRNNMRVTALKTGDALLAYIKENGKPDMVILDSEIKGLSCEETIKALIGYESATNRKNMPLLIFVPTSSRNEEIR